MKRIFLFLSSTVFLLSILTAEVFAANSVFSDIDGHWAEDTINKWQDMNIISGYPDGTFKPDNPVTRAELAKIITLAFNLQEKGSLEEYDDLDSRAWYYPYLEYAAQYIPSYPLPVGYTTNLPFTKNNEQGGHGFLPETDEIRMHFAETVVKIKTEKENLNIELPDIRDIQTSLLECFTDADYEELFIMHQTVPKNVRRMFEYTWLAKELDVMQGNSKGEFVPYNRVSRAEVIAVIDRMLEQ